MRSPFTKTVIIHASPFKVWNALTIPELVNQWMLDEPLEIITDWKAGSPLTIKGHQHWVDFENKGTVLQSEAQKLLQYSHLSSLSRLPDTPENYSIITFRLEAIPDDDATLLHFTLSGFPTESIYKHLVFYWNTTLGIFKSFVESEKH
jgi:uncharacterized protein YndB with AHSA1/START domain